jgi:IPT/TIG domain
MRPADPAIAAPGARPASGFSRSRAFAVVLLLSVGSALASGPRWVTGPPYFTGPSGNPVGWYTWQPLYFTDPGALSASMDHAAADAMVAAAAGVWNVPTAGLTIAYGGALNEHVSGANAYLTANGPVFPADVQSSNYATKQIAVIYDSDGSVTEMLLGGGASSPAQCRQNAVTESVDSIAPSGVIQHAILVLNGRCAGAAPQQQLQMQYQLERAFGRVLGIGWSQTNDNVFTGAPQPTPGQAQHWPIMHPIDIICGQYTYQCLPQPFTLRDDDVAAISSLYANVIFFDLSAPPPAVGKVWTYQQASYIYGSMNFPSGQGMEAVNVELQRQQGGWSIPEDWADVSAVTGARFQRNAGSPVVGAASGIAGSMGSPDLGLEGNYAFSWVPDIDPPDSPHGPMYVVETSEPINPLYVGPYSIGTYTTGNIEPSGAPIRQLLNRYASQPYMYPWSGVEGDFAPPDAAASCNTSGDGLESGPLPVTPAGWWTGVLCAHGHTAWSSFTAQAGRTATIEVTALDEAALATTAKAIPMIGVWNSTDPTGTLPTVAATPSALNTVTLGMTAANIATTQAQSLRFVIADARGDGRPDFAYRARVLYADSIQPSATSANGGLVTITGMGFRAGNQVTIGGVPAPVSSWTASSITAVVPPASALHPAPAGPLDVAVTDLSTGGSTVMSGAFSYANMAPDVMVLVSAPAGSVAVGATALSPFAVRVFLGDGVTPLAGLPVTFSVASGAGRGSARFAACAATPCVITTDATGLASSAVTPAAFGTVTLQAAAVGASQSATFNAVSRSIAMLRPAEYVAAGATVSWSPQATVIQNGAPAIGATVAWTYSSGMAGTALSLVGAQGSAQVTAIVGPLAAAQEATAEACAWNIVCAGFAAVGVDPSLWRLTILSGAGQSVPLAATFAPLLLMVTDSTGNPVAGAPVAVHQTVDAAQMPCPAHGRCPVAPQLGSSGATVASDADGRLTVVPMQVPGTAEVTNIAVATGTQGFISLSIDQEP